MEFFGLRTFYCLPPAPSEGAGVDGEESSGKAGAGVSAAAGRPDLFLLSFLPRDRGSARCQLCLIINPETPLRQFGSFDVPAITCFS